MERTAPRRLPLLGMEARDREADLLADLEATIGLQSASV